MKRQVVNMTKNQIIYKTKLIMQYLTFVGGRAAGDDRTVEQQVLEVGWLFLNSMDHMFVN